MKKIIILATVILVIVLIGVIYLIINPYLKRESNFSLFQRKEGTETKKEECFTIEERIVNGSSLKGIFEDGQTIKIFFGYYDCHEIKREDVIVYSYAGNEEPLIKIIKGISGDKFQLQKTENNWHILINGEILKNSENQSYILDERGHRMLSLYEKDYQGVIPPNTYLILGNLISGSLDSTRFGLIDKSDILGKVNPIEVELP